MYYFVIWMILAISATYNYARDDNYARIWAAASYLALVITAGLRYETGTDYLAYANIYELTRPLSDFSFSDSHIEPGYLLLNSLFRSMGTDVNIMFLFITVITMAVLFNSFKRYVGQKYYLLAVMLYYSITFFMLDMSGIRQAIAFSFFLVSLRYITEKKFFKYLLLIALAFCFHRSAALLLVVYPISRFQIKSWVHYATLGVGLALIVLKIAWLKEVFELGSGIFISGPMASKISDFISNEFFAIPRTISVGLIIYVPIYLLAVWKRKELAKTTPYYNTILNLFLFFIITLFFLYESYDISTRFSSYFSAAFALIFPLMLVFIRQNYRNLAIGFSVILFVSIFAMRHFVFGTEPSLIMYQPYQNYICYKLDMVKSNAEQRLYNMSTTNN